jgi:DNA segregation ATPase FtsK/SpoIIIE-like protein
MGIAEPLAADFIARMEREGVVSQPNALGRRKILIDPPKGSSADARSSA